MNETTEEPAAAEEPEGTEEPEAAELEIRDLDEEGLKGIAGEMIEIERERFEIDDEVFESLKFEAEDETILVFTERSMEELLEKGIEIKLLAAGETKVKIFIEGEEEPILEIPVVVEAPAAVPEEPAQEETPAPAEEPAADAEAPAEEQPSEEPAAEEPVEDSAEEPAQEQVPEPEETQEETETE